MLGGCSLGEESPQKALWISPWWTLRRKRNESAGPWGCCALWIDGRLPGDRRFTDIMLRFWSRMRTLTHAPKFNSTFPRTTMGRVQDHEKGYRTLDIRFQPTRSASGRRRRVAFVALAGLSVCGSLYLNYVGKPEQPEHRKPLFGKAAENVFL